MSMSADERHARQRLNYWHNRITASMAGRDSQDPHFLMLAYRFRDMWAGLLTQLEMEMDRERAA